MHPNNNIILPIACYNVIMFAKRETEIISSLLYIHDCHSVQNKMLGQLTDMCGLAKKGEICPSFWVRKNYCVGTVGWHEYDSEVVRV